MKQTPITRTLTTIDATNQSIGRLATKIAVLLQGKHKPTYEAHRDLGDSVEVHHAAKVKITGNKLENKVYYNYSGYPGGMRKRQLKTVMKNDPAETITLAVYSMLPKNRLRKERMKRLTVHNI